LGMLRYLVYVNSKKLNELIYTLLYFTASCLFKPSAVVFPLALICIDIIKQQKFEFKFILNKISFFAIAILFGMLNLKTQASAQFINYAHQFPFQEKLINAGYALFNYLKVFLMPVHLSVIYPFPVTTSITIIIGISVLCSFALIVYYLFKKKQFNYLAVILFVLVNLVLVLQFIPFGEVLNADRYMYLPIVGLGWLLGLLITKLNLKIPVVPAVLILVLGSLTFLRSSKWQSSSVLYEDIIKKYPNNYLALNSLGVEYMFKNNNDKALMYFNKAINIAPYNYKGFYNRALLYLKNNQPKAAIKDLNQVLNMYDYGKAYIARASAFYAVLDYANARNDAKSALLKDKNNHKAYFILGNCDNDQNDLQNAISFYNRAIELNKEEPDYYFKRAIALGKQQKFNECLNNLNFCIDLNPDYFEAYYWRGVAKVNLKLNPCDDFKTALEGGNALAKDALEKYCN
ncbi:MAG: tetratricopeptide repeat protein, partial [Bacteroidia bacterium]|nr:tetratricopeptide repeat protein [Bacteroidia bacterium]